ARWWRKGAVVMTALTGLLLAVLPSADSADEVPAKLEPYFRPPERLAKDLGEYRSPLRFRDGTEVKTAADWAKRRKEILDDWHGHLGPWPERLAKPQLRVLGSEKRDNFTQEHVEVGGAAKTPRKAYLLVPEGNGPFPAMLVVYYDPETGIGAGKAKLRDFAYQLARRGFVTLSIGSPPESYYPDREHCKLQPLSFHAYVASTCY